MTKVMQPTLIFSILLLASFGVVVHGQTVRDLESKYGQPIESFEIRPGVMMTVTYGADGQACEMSIQRRLASKEGVKLNFTLEPKLVDELIDELAPIASRGERKNKSAFETTISGDLMITDRYYENVTISMAGSVREGYMVLIIKQKQRQCGRQ